MKKLFKGLLAAVSVVTGLVITLVLLLDWKEEWLYEKFGKDKVLKFMKNFEPFIVMESDEEEVVEEVVEVAEEDLESED